MITSSLGDGRCESAAGTRRRRSGGRRNARGSRFFRTVAAGHVTRGVSMSTATRPVLVLADPVADYDQRRVALGYLSEAWAEARFDGIDNDCLAQASLFTAFAEFVSTYGEDAAARYAEALPARIRNGEFSLDLLKQ